VREHVLLRGMALATLAMISGCAGSRVSERPDAAWTEITVQGDTLSGRIRSLDPGGIEFDTAYGDGTLTIRYGDVEHLSSSDEFHIVYAEGGDALTARGLLNVVTADSLEVVSGAGRVTLVPTSAIITGVSAARIDESFWARMRGRFPHWQSRLDLGLIIEQGAVIKRKINVGGRVERRLRPTRLVLDLQYAFETQQTGDDPKALTKDELRVLVVGEYDVSERVYVFGLPAVEWDKPRNIEIRYFPSAGIGIRFFEADNALLQAQGGPGFVNSEFIGIGTSRYFGLSLSVFGRYEFGNGVQLSGNLFYLPALPRFDDGLFRAEADLRIPLVGPLALRYAVANTADNNPSGVGNNKFTTALGFTFDF
jgi:hypothetical protein